MLEKPLNLYIGLDKAFGLRAAQVCEWSVRKHASCPVNVTLLDQDWLRAIGLYHRQFFIEDGQYYDARDGMPFSTEFSFTRFLTPSLQPSGWAIFCDSDFMFRDDIADLRRLLDDRYALMCVKHEYQPPESVKMRGQIQSQYQRKNWSSLMAFNCGYPVRLTPFQVNAMPGSWLHQMGWLSDEEIGDLPEAWNWLDGHSTGPARAVHFTRGTPDMEGWEDTRYAQEWLNYGD